MSEGSAFSRWRWRVVAILVALVAALYSMKDVLGETTSLNLPWLIVVAVVPMALAAIFSVMVLRWGKRSSVHGSSGVVAPTPEAPGWPGWRRFKVHKRIVEDPAGRYVSILLSPENRRRLPAFLPGQWVRVRFEMPDPEQPQRMRDVNRPFFLSDSPNGRYYRILVERSTGAEEDTAITWLATSLQKGDGVELTTPTGESTMAPDGDSPLVVVSTGAGIAPALALCNTLLDRKSTRPFAWFHFMGDGSELILLPNFEFAASHLPGARLELCFGDAMPEGTVDGATSGDGVVYRKATLNLALLRNSTNFAVSHFFLCGPGLELDTLAADLGALDVPPERIVRTGIMAD
jgi:ferredoxin-NADP reductase